MRRSSNHLPVKNTRAYSWAYHTIFDPYFQLRGISSEGFERGVHYHHLDRLPDDSAPYFIAAKHESLLDIPVIGGLMLKKRGTTVHYVGKQELFNSHEYFERLFKKLKIGNYLSHKVGGWIGDGFSWYFNEVSLIPYDRDKNKDAQDAGELITQVIGKNGVVVMFPEKTRTPGPKLVIKERGLGALAVVHNVPIVPLGIAGTGKKWGEIHAVIGEIAKPGEITEDNRRRRMVEMEREYTANLQAATYEASDLAGIPYDLGV